MPDYILSIVEQIGLLLRELARARSAEKPERVSAIFLRENWLTAGRCEALCSGNNSSALGEWRRDAVRTRYRDGRIVTTRCRDE